MRLREDIVLVTALVALVGYGIPAFLLLRRGGLTRVPAVVMSVLLLVPVVNSIVLYALAWGYRRR